MDVTSAKTKANIVATWSLRGALLLALAFVLVLRANLVESMGVHWDEYNFLHHTYRVVTGVETRVLQTFHGHLFAWVIPIGDVEIDEILAGRWAMFAFGVATSALLGYLGWRLLGGMAGLFAAFLLSSFCFVQHHGTAFRYDGLLAMLWLSSASLLVSEARPRLTAVLAGVVGGLAVAVSIKTVMLLPSLVVLAGMRYWAEGQRRATLVRFSCFAAAGVLSTVLLLALHKATLAVSQSEVSGVAERAAKKVIDFSKPFPRSGTLVETLGWDTPMWVLLLIGFGILVGGMDHERGRRRTSLVGAGSLALPLLTLYFYRNSWPYYYVTILPGACLLGGAVWHRIERLSERRAFLALALALLAIAGPARTAFLWYANNREDENDVHRDIITAAHEIFPDPVPYVDRCAMLASFPKVGPFMTTWRMSDYRDAGKDIMPALLRNERPKMLITNIATLQLGRRHKRGSHALRPNDFRLLQDNFIPHWGEIWVAGKELTAAPNQGTRFEILIPGPYTYEGEVPVHIDEAVVAPGAVLELVQGEHRATSLEEAETKVVLRWGDHLHRPERKPLRDRRLFRGFSSKKPKEKWLNLFDWDDEAD